MDDGPFAPYPAPAPELEALGVRIGRHGTTLAAVGGRADRLGARASEIESDGLSGALMSVVRPVDEAASALQRAGVVAQCALTVWSRAVRAYDRAMRDLNAEWATAKASDFGVGSLELDRSAMKPTDVTDAVDERADAVDRARGQLWADLRRRQHREKERLDTVADTATTILERGPDALDSALIGVGLSGNGLAGWPSLTGTATIGGDDAEFESLRPGSPDALGAMGNYRENSATLAEALMALLGDPRQCVGDDASVDGCALEIAAWIPIPGLRSLKALRVAKYGKYADEARDAERAAEDAGELTPTKVGPPHEFDPGDLKGLSTDDVRGRIPEDWPQRPTQSGGGTTYEDPAHHGRQIRIMPGYPPGSRPDPLTWGPYAVVSQHGATVKVPLADNPTL